MRYRGMLEKYAGYYWWCYIAGVVLLVVFGGLWWTKVYLSPTRVFDGMLRRSLSTQSVTLENEQKSEVGTVHQYIQYQTVPQLRAHSVIDVVQGTTKVKTEMIGEKSRDYTRYVSISTQERNAAGKPLDVSKVTGVWAATDTKQPSVTNSQLLTQSVLGLGLPLGSVPVPIGFLPTEKRDALLEQIQQTRVYETNTKKVTKKTVKGHQQYTYTVKVQTIPYVRLMQTYAKAVGMHELDTIDPNSYQSSAPMEVKLTVDAVSRRLVQVESGGVTVRYVAYGVPVRTNVPTQHISMNELQKRLLDL